MLYRPPVQERAMKSERRFIESSKKLFAKFGVAATSIDDIASDAGLHRGAFLKRFGSKDGAKHLIVEDYCKVAVNAIAAFRCELQVGAYKNIEAAMFAISNRLEAVHREQFAASRAMFEDYACGLELHIKTRDIFRALTVLVEDTDRYFNANDERGKRRYYACAQLMVFLNLEYVLSAKPAMPKDEVARHRLIASAALIALSQGDLGKRNTKNG